MNLKYMYVYPQTISGRVFKNQILVVDISSEGNWVAGGQGEERVWSLIIFLFCIS